MKACENECCWHQASIQHMANHHLDVNCCHCRKTECCDTRNPPGHGEVSNDEDWVIEDGPPSLKGKRIRDI